MGTEYNQLGEECKSSKQEKERKFVWVGGADLHIHVFGEGAVFTWSFLANNGVLSAEA
jgi:hypothetical protein